MIAIVVPAHNEEVHIAACLQSILVAAACPALAGEAVQPVVVLDDCSDATGSIAKSFGVRCLKSRARNVGIARAAGAQAALASGARWLAFTDADSEVAPDWIAAQLRQRTDAVCGTVQVRDWGCHGEDVRRHFQSFYRDCDGHRHIHGANMGLTASAYHAAGGFQPLVTGEDVALVQRLQACGLSIAWTAGARVTTSPRRHFRAPEGFGSTLLTLGGLAFAASTPAQA